MCPQLLSGEPVPLGGVSSLALCCERFTGRQTSRPNRPRSVFTLHTHPQGEGTALPLSPAGDSGSAA